MHRAGPCPGRRRLSRLSTTMNSSSDKLFETKGSSVEMSDRSLYVDIHCHCLAAVDDGPATMDEALALCRGLADDGIGVVVATPHQLGRYCDANEASQIRKAVSDLDERLRQNRIPLSVMPGGDVRVDERICQLLEQDKILTLADGGRYVLLELPHEVFIDIQPLIVQLASMGIEVIVSHPERHPVLARDFRVLLKWLERGVYLQVTAGSLLGEFGSAAQNAAWHFLASGWSSFVATDAHDLSGRAPRMNAAYKQISGRLGNALARLVCSENPLRVLEGRNIQTGFPTTARRRDVERTPSSL